MKSLSDYINESLSSSKVDEIIDAIVEYLSYELDDEKEGMYIEGKDIYLQKDLMVGINPKNGKWEVGPAKNIEGKFELTFDPTELTHVEYETFVTTDLEDAIRAALEK